jgi:hypothetical protein
MYRPREEFVDRNTQARQEASRLVAEQMAPEYEALAEQQRQVDDNLMWTNIVRTPINGKYVADNLANRQIVFGWLHPGEAPTVAWFKKVLEDQALANQITFESADTRDPVKRQQANAAQLEHVRQVFAQACRQLRVSENTANFNLIREVLGSDFDVYGVQQAIQSGAVRLAQATQEEIAAWAQEAVEQRNRFLLDADNQTLRTIVRRESAERHQAAAQAEADRSFKVSQAMDAAIGFPPLPATWKGQPLNAAFIRSCDVETQKLLTKRFGSAALTTRLRGN